MLAGQHSESLGTRGAYNIDRKAVPMHFISGSLPCALTSNTVSAGVCGEGLPQGDIRWALRYGLLKVVAAASRLSFFIVKSLMTAHNQHLKSFRILFPVNLLAYVMLSCADGVLRSDEDISVDNTVPLITILESLPHSIEPVLGGEGSKQLSQQFRTASSNGPAAFGERKRIASGEELAVMYKTLYE